MQKENWITILKNLLILNGGSDSACGFNVFMGVIVMLLSLFYMVWESIYLIKEIDGYDCHIHLYNYSYELQPS